MNVFRGMEYRGKLYSFPAFFRYPLVGVNNSFSEVLTGIFKQYDKATIREVLDMYNGLSNRGGRYLDRNFDALYAVQECFNAFADYESKVCRFDSDEFIKLITDAKVATDPRRIEYDELLYTFGLDFSRAAQEGAALQYLFCFADITQYEVSFPLTDEGAFSHFVPVANEKGRLILKPLKEFFINENSENKELAWEFVKFLASPEYINEQDLWQGIPVSKEAFNTYAPPYVMGMIDLRRRDGEGVVGESADIARNIVSAVEYSNNMPMESTKYTPGDSVADILREAMLSYYSNVLTAKQVASQLQNRISLYFME